MWIGTPRRAAKRVASNGMAAPPPTMATAPSFAMLLCRNMSSIPELNSSKGPDSSCSNWVRVNSTSSPVTEESVVTDAVDRFSLAWRHWSSRRASDPIRVVLASPPLLSIGVPSRRWSKISWSIESPEKSRYRTGAAIWAKPDSASLSVTVVPLAPKSHNAITPLVGKLGSARSAVSAAVASEISAGGTPFGASPGWAKNSSRSAADLSCGQYAGTAMVTGVP
ncbi:hypothetical protein MYSI104531_21015 [Mycobacterium simiae]